MKAGERIRMLRKSAGFSREELAEKLGVSKAAVVNWETGVSTPEIENIAALGTVFGVTPDYIINGKVSASERGQSPLSTAFFIASSAFMGCGLAFGIIAWFFEKDVSVVIGAAVIQAIGIAVYYIGKLLTRKKPPHLTKLLNTAFLLVMPISVCIVYGLHDEIAPFPVDLKSGWISAAIYAAILTIEFLVLRKHKERENAGLKFRK